MTRNFSLCGRKWPFRRSVRVGAFLLALTAAGPLAASAAAIAAADHQEGYAGVVLGKLCEIWTPPADTGNRMVRVRISVNGDGSVLGCTPTQRSGTPALDNSVCEAARKLGKLETPPYAMPIDVHLAFWSGTPRRAPAQQGTITVSPSGQAIIQTAAPAAPAPVVEPPAATPPAAATGGSRMAQDAYAIQFHGYLNKVARQLREASFVPVEAPRGSYYVTVRLTVAKNGAITNYEIVQSSGNDRIDTYVRQGVKRAGKVTPPPAGLASPFDVTLTMVR